jgi:hypothetical protein
MKQNDLGFLGRNVPSKVDGSITVVGYLGIGVGLFFMALPVIGIAAGTVHGDAPGAISFIFGIGALIAIGCYRYVRR